MAHIDAGKTTTTERILYYAGVSRRMGEVHDGSAFTDWMLQEQERGISITAASTSFSWRDHRCNLIDTPGHVDFTAEVERSLHVLDGAVAIFCAVRGVEPQSETVWRQADRHAIPRVAFINKCDRPGADPNAVAEEIRLRLDANPIVLQMPHALEEEFGGIVDLVHFRSRVWDDASLGMRYDDIEVPADLRDEAMLARQIMLEALAEVDDAVMEKYLAESEISPSEIVSALRRATLGMRAVPVLVGAAFRNKGVQGLLDAIVDYLPSPVDLPPASGVNPQTQEREVRRCSDDEPACALAFKIMNDPEVGQVTYLRVYSGVVRAGDPLINATKDRIEKPERLVVMHANHREEVRELRAGDIGAAVGLRSAATGDTLCDRRAPLLLEQMSFPEPVVRVSIEADTDEDQDRLERGLMELAAEDPTFRVSSDPDSNQTVISGMGELHIEILVDRLRREFQVAARVGRPRVAYRETIRSGADGAFRYQAESGGRGQFAEVEVELVPGARGSGLVVELDPDGAIPREYRTAVEGGIREGLERGALAGFPMTDVCVRVVGGLAHAVDSSEMSFKIAALRAFRAALQKAESCLLEPVALVEVVAPDEYVGEVIGDLNARRGKIAGIVARHGVQVVACLVPLATMFGYATDLRSRTQGRATFSMQIQKYAEVPTGISEAVVAKATGA